jgi:excisionase family DNA binding protein
MLTDTTITDRLDALEGLVRRLLDQRAPSRWLTVAEAAQHSRLSEESIRRLIATRRLTPHYPRRGRILIDRVELDAHIAGSVRRPAGGRGQRAAEGGAE